LLQLTTQLQADSPAPAVLAAGFGRAVAKISIKYSSMKVEGKVVKGMLVNW